MVRHFVLVEVSTSVPATSLDQATTLTIGTTNYTGILKGVQEFSDPPAQPVASHTHPVALAGPSGTPQ